MNPEPTFLALAAARRRTLHEILRRVAIGRGAIDALRAVCCWRRPSDATSRSGVVAQIPHASTLPDRSIRETHPKQLHPAVGARPRVVSIVAAVGALPRHPARHYLPPTAAPSFLLLPNTLPLPSLRTAPAPPETILPWSDLRRRSRRPFRTSPPTGAPEPPLPPRGLATHRETIEGEESVDGRSERTEREREGESRGRRILHPISGAACTDGTRQIIYVLNSRGVTATRPTLEIPPGSRARPPSPTRPVRTRLALVRASGTCGGRRVE